MNIIKTMKKIKSSIVALALCMALGAVFSSVPALAASKPENGFSLIDETGNDGENMISPMSVSLSTNLSLKSGGQWTKTFDMKTTGEAHNAFKVVVSGVSGKYKVFITNNKNDRDSEFGEYATSRTFKLTNANSAAKYTVRILNTGSGKLSAKVKISSYYDK